MEDQQSKHTASELLPVQMTEYSKKLFYKKFLLNHAFTIEKYPS